MEIGWDVDKKWTLKVTIWKGTTGKRIYGVQNKNEQSSIKKLLTKEREDRMFWNILEKADRQLRLQISKKNNVINAFLIYF